MGGRLAGAFAHQRLAGGVIDDDVVVAQIRLIGGGGGNLDGAVAVEAVAHGDAAGGDAFHAQRHDVLADERNDALQRTYPAQALGGERSGAPALRFGPVEAANDGGDRLG